MISNTIHTAMQSVLVEGIRTTDSESHSQKAAKQSRVFCAVVYADRLCEVRKSSTLAEYMIDYLTKHKHIFEYAYILHDRDVYTEEDEFESEGVNKAGSPKPPHYHILYKTKGKSTPKGQQKFWGQPFMVQICADVTTAMLYLVHDTPESMVKAQYKWEEVTATEWFADHVSEQNSNFVQFASCAEMATDGLTVFEMFAATSDYKTKHFIIEKASALCQLTNQQHRRDEERNATNREIDTLKAIVEQLSARLQASEEKLLCEQLATQYRSIAQSISIPTTLKLDDSLEDL